MAKFCPECGHEMVDNAKFCMECGAKFEDYESNDCGDICPKCEFKLKNIFGTFYGIVTMNGKKVPYELEIYDGSQAYICPKCKYKTIFSRNKVNSYPDNWREVNKSMKCYCGGEIKGKFGQNDKITCLECGYTNYVNDFFREFSKQISTKALENEGFDIIL